MLFVGLDSFLMYNARRCFTYLQTSKFYAYHQATQDLPFAHTYKRPYNAGYRDNQDEADDNHIENAPVCKITEPNIRSYKKRGIKKNIQWFPDESTRNTNRYLRNLASYWEQLRSLCQRCKQRFLFRFLCLYLSASKSKWKDLLCCTFYQ